MCFSLDSNKIVPTHTDILHKNMIQIQEDINTIHNLPRNYEFSIKQHIE